MPRKYRQAKAAARPAAEAAFPGKKKAGRRDPMVKYSAEDRELFRELQQESKKGYLTTDKGEKVFVKPDETAKERIARERKEAMRKYRERVEAEDGPKKATKKSTATIKQVRKPARPAAPKASMAEKLKKPVNVPGTPLSAKKKAKVVITKADTEKAKTAKAKPEVKLTPAGEAVKKRMPGMSNAAANDLGTKVKTKSGKGTVYSITNVQPEKATKGTVKPKFVQKKAPVKKAVSKPETGKTVAVRPKGPVATTAKAAATTAAKKGGVAGALKGAGRVAGKVIGGRVGMALTAAALAKPVLKALVQTPADKKKEKAAKGKTPGPEARSNQPRITGQGRFVGAGGATTKVGSSYTVKKGDTLSGIAKNAGVSLADIRAANPKIMTNKKYKQGAAIWSGTKVRIPKK
jgi:LysM repeat protein